MSNGIFNRLNQLTLYEFLLSNQINLSSSLLKASKEYERKHALGRNLNNFREL